MLRVQHPRMIGNSDDLLFPDQRTCDEQKQLGSLIEIMAVIDARTLGSAVLGLLFLGIWIAYDARSRAPFVSLQMFRISQVRIISIVTFLFGFTSIGYLGINNLALSIGIAFGAASARMIAANNTTDTSISLAGFQAMWSMMIVAAIITAIVALSYKRSELDPSTGRLRTVPPATSSDNLPATEKA